MHVIKGAIVKIYGIPTGKTTRSVHFSENGTWQGSITVCHESLTKPTQEQKQEMERLCNQLIKDNIDITIQSNIDRSQAEKEFGNQMYDAFPVPSSIKSLNILQIKDWNINCCPKQHLAKTGELIAMKIGKCKFNNKQKSLTVYFTVGQKAA